MLAGMAAWTALVLSGGCGGGAMTRSGDSGSMDVHLVDGPTTAYLAIDLNIQKVEIATTGGWEVLGSPNRTVDLLTLTGGLAETLAQGAMLPAGHYEQMRLILGPGNSVTLADNSVNPLVVPSALNSGVKLIGSFQVPPGAMADEFIDFDAAHSIQVVQTGASSQFILRPTVRAVDKLATGAISGRLTDGNGAPIAGAAVFAEVLDGSGRASIIRSTFSDGNGAYTLDLLPLGATYYAVSQPEAGTASVTAYDAKASGGIALSGAVPAGSYSASFTADASIGQVTGSITPVAGANQSDTVALSEMLTLPSGTTGTFIVNTTVGTVTTSPASAETYAFPVVPAAAFTVSAVRTTLGSDGSTATADSSLANATVTGGQVTTADVQF
jgi:hypothetical protein